MDEEFWNERIESLKLQIIAYENAILAFGNNGAVQSYTLDTGQSKQIVTRADLRRLNDMLDSLYNRLNMTMRRINGGHVTIARPHF